MGMIVLTHRHLPSQVLKVAILAEKYAVDYSWYVDTILNLIRIAGDYVSEEVWYRVLQIVTNRDDVQGYAAKTVFEVSSLRVDPVMERGCQSGAAGQSSAPPAGASFLLSQPWLSHPRTWELQPWYLPRGREADTASVQESWPLHSSLCTAPQAQGLQSVVTGSGWLQGCVVECPLG